MFKVIFMMKRKPGTSMQDLINYYETKHSKLTHRFAKATTIKYIRRYFHPMDDPIPEGELATEPEYDMATELWFDSRHDWDRMIEMATPFYDEIAEDEARFLDRKRRRLFIVEEYESDLSK